MINQIQAEHFSKALYLLLDEPFDNVQGFFLDKGTSMFETLPTVSAEDASVPVGGKCVKLAAQVKHTAFYLDLLERNVRLGTSKASIEVKSSAPPAQSHLKNGIRPIPGVTKVIKYQQEKQWHRSTSLSRASGFSNSTVKEQGGTT